MEMTEFFSASFFSEMNPDNHYRSSRQRTLWDAHIHSASLLPQFLILSSSISYNLGWI